MTTRTPIESWQGLTPDRHINGPDRLKHLFHPVAAIQRGDLDPGSFLATLKRGQTLADLQERARAKTDLQAAQEMQKTKADLFALFNKPKTQQQAA